MLPQLAFYMDSELKPRKQELYQLSHFPDPGLSLEPYFERLLDMGGVLMMRVPLVLEYQTHKVLGQQLLLVIQRDFCCVTWWKESHYRNQVP